MTLFLPIMILNVIDLNSALQWGSVIVLLAIVAVVVFKRIVRFHKNFSHDDGPDCGSGCGCCGVTDCQLRDLKNNVEKKKQKR